MTGIGPDFLASIAAKAVGTAPLVEPRLPSRFEARPEGAGDFARAWEEPLELEAMPRPYPPPRRRAVAEPAGDSEPAGRQAAQTAGPAEPRLPDRAGKADQAPATAREVAQAPPAPVAPHRPAAARAAGPSPAREPPPPLLVVPAGAELRDAPERVAPRPAFEIAAPAAREQERLASPVAEAAAPDAAATNRIGAPAPAPAAQPRPPAAELTLRSPEAGPRPTRGERRAAETEPAARPPVVNITIGRIEVRAPAASAARPSRPARAPSPAPESLADYLKRRGGDR
jgi:hypothetical protein